jgi:hypothetical protein
MVIEGKWVDDDSKYRTSEAGAFVRGDARTQLLGDVRSAHADHDRRDTMGSV